MDISTIRWGVTEYTLKDFVNKFENSFPKIIKVTEGFLGRQELDSISSSTILRVHSLYSQDRAVVESISGKIFSLPAKMKQVLFLVIRPIGKPEGPFNLLKILEENVLPVTIRPTQPLTFQEMNNPTSACHRVELLTVTQVFKETFLLGHSINSKGFLEVQTPLVLPMYMKQVRLALAEGLEDDNEEKWDAACTEYSQTVQQKANMGHFIFEEISLLDKQEIMKHRNMYSEVEPIYMDLNKELKKPTPPPLPEKNVACKFFRFADVPKDLHEASVDEICDCLLLLNLNQYVQSFRTEQIDGQFLYDLDEALMQENLGMSKLHVAKLLRFRDGWRPRLEESI
ncbi:uncharacterized protein LOC120541598 [Polypterus senegalus]